MNIRRKLLIAGAVMVPVIGTGGFAYASVSGAAAAPTPVTATAPQTSEAPSAPESGTVVGTAEADGPGGHQDPAGSNVDHQFQGQE